MAQPESAAEAIDLGDRRFLQRAVGLLEDAARVGHRRVEELLEELVAQVVVGGDVSCGCPPACCGEAG